MKKHIKQEFKENVCKVKVELKTDLGLRRTEKKSEKENNNQLQVVKEKEQQELKNFGHKEKTILEEAHQKPTEMEGNSTQKQSLNKKGITTKKKN